MRAPLRATPCLHCGQPCLGTNDEFCCCGCEAVYHLLREEGLERYYELRRGLGTPVEVAEHRDEMWLDAVEQKLETETGVHLDVQGLHCAGCVWLIEELFHRHSPAGAISINSALGRLRLTVDRTFPLRAFVGEVEGFGYRLGPPIKRETGRSDGLLLRVGICVALAGNSMLFAIATYLGLEAGPVYDLMMQLQYAFAAVSVLVGGSVFIAAAYRGLRRGLLSLDLPIALGIVLAFFGSTLSYFVGADAIYFDTVAVFIALMLVGRWLQERVLERNRRQLLESDGAASLLTRRLAAGRVETVPVTEVKEDDRLLIAPRDLIPVASRSADGPVLCSLDWINGESAPRRFSSEAPIPAGAFLAGDASVTVVAGEDFDRSSLGALLQGVSQDAGASEPTCFWDVLARRYVVLVLLAASLGFAGWALAGDLWKGMEVAVAVLVVTCPCAFGIATPLGYELVQGGLRRIGLFVRTRRFLDRLLLVRRVWFDKTGTLTMSALSIRTSAVDRLDEHLRQALFELASRSNHPKSVAIATALRSYGLRLGNVTVTEHPGAGVEAEIGHCRYRLGSAAFTSASGHAGAYFAVRGTTNPDEWNTLAEFEFGELLRPDARREVAGLQSRGLAVGILSGDLPDRVASVAEEVGIPAAEAFSSLDPQAKAAIIAEGEGPSLFLGDGVNDALAADAAWVSGTPAIDRPFMAARSDFYLVTPGLWPLAQALRAAGALAQTVRINLTFAVTYNAVAVAIAWAGWMEPWMAAVLMPVSSLLTLAFTLLRLNPRSRLWKF
ncbi:MAG: heavy metal translocating P-type ATPase metal-binding domain-containing protein [Myxococcota bacterium]